MEHAAVQDSLLEVVEGSDFGRVSARLPIVFHSGHGVQGLDTYRIIWYELAAYDCCTE